MKNMKGKKHFSRNKDLSHFSNKDLCLKSYAVWVDSSCLCSWNSLHSIECVITYMNTGCAFLPLGTSAQGHIGYFYTQLQCYVDNIDPTFSRNRCHKSSVLAIKFQAYITLLRREIHRLFYFRCFEFEFSLQSCYLLVTFSEWYASLLLLVAVVNSKPLSDHKCHV